MQLRSNFKKITHADIQRIEKLVSKARRPAPVESKRVGMVRWIQENLRIKPKRGGLEPFILNKFQRKVCAKIVKNMKQKKASRIILLKSRQLGMSTVSEAIVFWALNQFPNTSGLVLAHTDKASSNVYAMTKRFQSHLPDGVKLPLIGRPSKEKMEWAAPHASTLWQFTAGGQEIGRSWTLNWVHASEMAFYPNVNTVMTALNQTVPDPSATHMSVYIIESTAQGLNLFHDYWQRAQEPDSLWEPFFFSWVDDPECSVEVAEDPRFDQEELQFQQTHRLTDGQLLWARNVRLDQCNGSWNTFHQEYPATPDLAFLASGINVFDLNVVMPQLKSAEKLSPMFVGEIRSKSKSNPVPHLDSNALGNLTIWEEPLSGCEYVIGADCAEGIGAAFSEAVILKRDPVEEVAHYRSNIVRPQEFGVILWLLGAYYGFALLGVERNSVGQAVLAVLEHGHGDRSRYPYLRRYPRLYYETVLDRKTIREGERLGYSTSTKTKQAAIVRLSEAVSVGDIYLRSVPLLTQMAGFTWDPEKGKYEETAKDPISELRADDAVFALVMANEMRLHIYTRGFCSQPLREDW